MQNKSLLKWQGSLCVMGVDWGDSGKGRMIDDLSQNAHVVARYNGGSNTGHTIKNQFGEFALHIVPSGIFNKNAQCLVGKNVAVDLLSLVDEMKILKAVGVSCKKLKIDAQAHITMPWHKLRDGLREKFRSQDELGTTGKGVGPTYADRAERVGLLVKDLISAGFREKLNLECQIQNKFYGFNLKPSELYTKYKKLSETIKPLIGETSQIVKDAQKAGKNVLFEGAQGYFLDIDAGTYPFVTSSNPGVVGITRSFDIHPSQINEVIGITKAYTTRVGEGPMPTTIEANDARLIIDKGKEKGTTTGRVRRPGWLDLELIKAAADANKLTGLAITKLDVLSAVKTIKVCTSYRLKGKRVHYKSHDGDFLSQVKPEYKEFESWQEDVSLVRKYARLPKTAQQLIREIEKHAKLPVRFISVGPNRGEVIYVQ